MRHVVLGCALLSLPAIASAQQAETIEYYQADLVGSIRIVYDVNGNVIGRQDFMPFGTPVLNGTSMPSEGFGGNEKDDETQQMYFHARSLSARTGRFNGPDPIGGDPTNPQRWNRYSYALNNAIRFVDLSGLNADPNDCHWIDANPETDFPGAWSCGSQFSSGTDSGGGGGGGFWSSVISTLFGGGTPDLSGVNAFFNGGLSSGSGSSSGFDSGSDRRGGGGGSTVGSTQSTPGSGSSSATPGLGSGQNATQPPTGSPSPVGDAQINAIAAGVNRGAGLFARPSTYGIILGVSAAPTGLVAGYGLASAGAAQAGIWGEAQFAGYVGSASLGAQVIRYYDLLPGGLTQSILDVAMGRAPGPSVGSRLMAISNLISCWGGCVK